MAAKKAEFIFVGDADSVIKAARAANAAVGKSAAETEKANNKTAESSKRSGSIIQRSHQGIKSSFAGVAKSAIGMGVATVGAYASIAGAKKAVDTTETLAKTTLTLHKSFGLTVKSASEWAGISQARGADGKQMTMGFKALATATRNAREGIKSQGGAVDDLQAKQERAVKLAIADGKSTADITRLKQNQAVALDALSQKGSAQAKAFKTLGISQEDLVKHGNNVEWVLRAVSDGLGKMPTGTDKAAVAAKLFGRTWTTIAPLIRGGSKAMDENLALAEKYGVTLKGKTVKSVEDLISAQRENKLAMMGLQVAVGQELIPEITKGTRVFSTFVAGMREGTGAGGKFAAAAKQVWGDLKPVRDTLKSIGQYLLAHPKLITAVVLAYGGFKVLAAVTAGMHALAVAVLGVDAAMDANVIGAIVLGLAALAGGLIYAYKHSETFRKGIDGLFSLMKAGAVGALKLLIKALDVLAGGMSTFLGVLGHVPGFGWATKAQHSIDKARDATQAWVDSLGKLPTIKNLQVNVDAKLSPRLKRLLDGDVPGSTSVSKDPPVKLHKKAAGGLIPGSGDGDTVPAMLTPGEHVTRKAIVAKFGPTVFNDINDGRLVALLGTFDRKRHRAAIL